jgi:hypothetical protein
MVLRQSHIIGLMVAVEFTKGLESCYLRVAKRLALAQTKLLSTRSCACLALIDAERITASLIRHVKSSLVTRESFIACCRPRIAVSHPHHGAISVMQAWSKTTASKFQVFEIWAGFGFPSD